MPKRKNADTAWMDEDEAVAKVKLCNDCGHDDEEHSFSGPCTVPRCNCYEFIKAKDLKPA